LEGVAFIPLYRTPSGIASHPLFVRQCAANRRLSASRLDFLDETDVDQRPDCLSDAFLIGVKILFDLTFRAKKVFVLCLNSQHEGMNERSVFAEPR
jgi:hypothetical protein